MNDLVSEITNTIAQARRDDRDADPDSRVYFARESSVGAIKIGKSKHARKRVSELNFGALYGVTLLATIEGGCCVESALHTFFQRFRIRGEWFHPVPELLAYIEKEGEDTETTRKREMEVAGQAMRDVKGIVAR